MKCTLMMFATVALVGVFSSACTTTPSGCDGEACGGSTCDGKQETAYRDTSKIQEKTGAQEEGVPSQISPEIARRIATLQNMLLVIEEDPERIDTIDGPHAQRLQDPEIIRDAIARLKQGKDICTRCLMVCGAAD